MSTARTALRQHGRIFSLANALLPHVYAERVETLYAFCRYVDDLADNARDFAAAHGALDAVRSALLTNQTDDPTVQALLDLCRQTVLPKFAALTLVEGVVRDLSVVRIASEPELLDYAWCVAGTVGVMMCAVLDVRDPRAIPFAIDLGIAMQLTNISRDVGSDARLGRRYLPATWVGDVAPEAIVMPNEMQQAILRKGTRRTLELAEIYYRSGESGLGYLPWRARLAILAAARMYRAIGQQVAQANYCSWDRRAALGLGEKCLHVARAVGVFLITPRIHRRDVPHDPCLKGAQFVGSNVHD